MRTIDSWLVVAVTPRLADLVLFWKLSRCFFPCTACMRGTQLKYVPRASASVDSHVQRPTKWSFGTCVRLRRSPKMGGGSSSERRRLQTFTQGPTELGHPKYSM